MLFRVCGSPPPSTAVAYPPACNEQAPWDGASLAARWQHSETPDQMARTSRSWTSTQLESRGCPALDAGCSWGKELSVVLAGCNVTIGRRDLLPLRAPTSERAYLRGGHCPSLPFLSSSSKRAIPFSSSMWNTEQIRLKRVINNILIHNNSNS